MIFSFFSYGIVNYADLIILKISIFSLFIAFSLTNIYMNLSLFSGIISSPYNILIIGISSYGNDVIKVPVIKINQQFFADINYS